MNESQVRRAINTLKKNKLITPECVFEGDLSINSVIIIISVDGDLLIPKQRKLKLKKNGTIIKS